MQHKTKPGAGPGRETGGHKGSCGVKEACRDINVRRRGQFLEAAPPRKTGSAV
jgi:hypothetical protein